jgi:hypothetical protein
MNDQERGVIVKTALRAFRASFPAGVKDASETMSIAADLSASLVATVAASGDIPLDKAEEWFVSAVERRLAAFHDPPPPTLKQSRGRKDRHAKRNWRCFHCDEVFTTAEAAREHFGPHELADPACQIDITKFREMEHYHARCLAEDSDSERAWHAKSADHARALIEQEQKGFDRGLRAQLEKIAPDTTCPYCERQPAESGIGDDEGFIAGVNCDPDAGAEAADEIAALKGNGDG